MSQTQAAPKENSQPCLIWGEQKKREKRKRKKNKQESDTKKAKAVANVAKGAKKTQSAKLRFICNKRIK